MDEHDDDLESTVHEGAENETDTFSDSGDEVDATDSAADDSDEEPDIDEDEAEL